MPTIAFSPPRHWEDWAGLILGLWLLVSPWVLEYVEVSASQNAVFVGFLVIATEFVALYVFNVWEEWISVILGAWLLVSPWILGVALVPTVNFVIVGLLVLALALHEIWDERRHAAVRPRG